MLKSNKISKLENEIVRLENILLEKENIIKNLQDEIAMLNLRKYIYYQGEGNINKYYYETKTTTKNNAIYDTLIFILKYIKVDGEEWLDNIEKYQLEAKNLILQLIEERNSNND